MLHLVGQLRTYVTYSKVVKWKILGLFIKSQLQRRVWYFFGLVLINIATYRNSYPIVIIGRLCNHEYLTSILINI